MRKLRIDPLEWENNHRDYFLSRPVTHCSSGLQKVKLRSIREDKKNQIKQHKITTSHWQAATTTGKASNRENIPARKHIIWSHSGIGERASSRSCLNNNEWFSSPLSSKAWLVFPISGWKPHFSGGAASWWGKTINQYFSLNRTN